ncbi:MAG: SMC-Scp complex subunit ScpB [Chloroflexota bacterium]
MNSIGQPEQADYLASLVESLLLVATEPVSISQLRRATGAVRPDLRSALETVRQRLQGGIRLQVHQGKIQLVSAPENAEAVRRFLGVGRQPPLPRSAMEALTVIAYRQPVTRADIAASRGVHSDRAVQTLLARGLIEEVGPRQTVGRPMQYGTGFSFLEYFGLSGLDELPPIELDGESSLEPVQLGLRPSSEQID